MATNLATSQAIHLATSLAMNSATSMAIKPASGPAMSPATSLLNPSYPFELVYSNYLYVRKFHIIIDRHSARVSMHDVGENEGAQGIISALKTHFTTFGSSMEITSDKGQRYKASSTKRFLADWGVKHRPSSAHPPHSIPR